jgi:N-glycosylase/DNA lyase
MSWSEGGDCFQMIERRGANAHRISVTESKRTRSKVTLQVCVDGVVADRGLSTWAMGRVARALSLHRDLSEFYALCENHPSLWVVPYIGAGRMLRSTTMTENVVKAICATNVNWTQAVKMINRLGQLGPPIRHFVNLNSWPTPREILRAGEGYLKEVCRLGYRSATIMKFCEDVCEGRRDVECLYDLADSADVSSDELLEHLRPIPGIGPSSSHFLLSALGRNDRMSIDSATIAFVAKAHFNGKKPTPKQVERVYEKYGRWKNLVWWLESWLTWGTGSAMAAAAARGKRPAAKSRAAAIAKAG